MKRLFSFLMFAVVMCFFTILPAETPAAENTEAIRLSYNNPGLVVDLGVGLWAIPLPMDWDSDGDNDLLVSTAGVPDQGLYYFQNDGSGIFRAGQRLAIGKKNVTISYVENGIKVCEPTKVYHEFRSTLYNNPTDIPFGQSFYSGRANQWKFADYDGDNVDDLIIGVSDWRDYGWDNAFDLAGRWTHGSLHGYVYWVKNVGSNETPQYADAKRIRINQKPLDVFGCPSPNLVDWDGDGDLDLICGEFLDRITFFENSGTRTHPIYQPGRFLKSNGKRIHMELEMLQVVVMDWDQDGDLDIVVGQEDGRVALIENTGIGQDGLPDLKPPKFFKQRAKYVKCGALVTPCSVDWDGDGDDDLICGNTAGFLEWIENLDGNNPPKWAAPKRLRADGRVIRIMAGKNLSIQGPAEAKWGYTVPYVADWDMDGLPDIVINSVVGKIQWYRNLGTPEHLRLAEAQPVQVQWNSVPPKPAWNWWNPGPKELVVQWRTRPIVLDLNRDGLNDLIAIDHEGYLSFFKREQKGAELILLPGKRIFLDEEGKALRLNHHKAGKSGRRKIDMVDWDGDGDLDLLINSPGTSPKNTRNIALYKNIGEKDSFIFSYQGDIMSSHLEGHTTCPTTTDWNQDGIRDLLVGAEDGFLYYYQRRSPHELMGER